MAGGWLVAMVLALGWMAACLPAGAATIDEVKARGSLQCGVGTSKPGFATIDAQGVWHGLEVDFCRALSAAIFNDAGKVVFQPFSSDQGPEALSAGKVDLLSGSDTWTMQLDTGMSLKFAGTLFFDGQGFMVRKASGATSVRDLGGARICILDDSYALQSISDYFAANNIEYTPVTMDTPDNAVAAYRDGRCDVLSEAVSTLAAARSGFPDKDKHLILPEIAAKEPLGLAVRVGDDDWLSLVRWVYFALLDAEGLGVTSSNIDQMLGSDNVEIRRLLGVEGDFGTSMGVSKDWAYQIIKLVGNYAEVFDRNVGPKTPLELSRGLNALARDGGLQFAPSIR